MHITLLLMGFDICLVECFASHLNGWFLHSSSWFIIRILKFFFSACWVGIFLSDVSLLIFSLGSGWCWVVSFMPQLLDPHSHSGCYVSNRKLCGSQIQSGFFREEKSLTTLWDSAPHLYLCVQIVLLQKAYTSVTHESQGTTSEIANNSTQYTWCVQVLRSPKEAFAAAMQSWRERCEKCVCLQGDYLEKWLRFQLPVVSNFLK